MLKITKKIPVPEKRKPVPKAEKVAVMRRGLEAHQHEELDKQIAEASAKIITECKRVLNDGIRLHVDAAIEKGINSQFEIRVEKAADVFFNNKAELKKFPLMTFAETMERIDAGWRVLDIVHLGSKEDGIWMRRFHKDRKEEVKKVEKPVAKPVLKKRVKVSITRK